MLVSHYWIANCYAPPILFGVEARKSFEIPSLKPGCCGRVETWRPRCYAKSLTQLVYSGPGLSDAVASALLSQHAAANPLLPQLGTAATGA